MSIDFIKKRMPLSLKKIYRSTKWFFYNLLTLWQSERIVYVRTDDLIYGLIEDFSPFSTFNFKRSGDWDKKIILIEENIVYRTMFQRFTQGASWEETPHYIMELKNMNTGLIPSKTKEEVDATFKEWDILFENIRNYGFKSNHALYAEGKTDDILSLLDEITVNVGRDGKLILNSGWHRVISAKLLKVPELPVRILVTHSEYKLGLPSTCRALPDNPGSSLPT